MSDDGSLLEYNERAARSMPGGVSSPVRAFRAVGGSPLVVREARGATLVDVDGRELLDFVCSWGPLILGHAHPEVVEAVAEAAGRGTSYGATSPVEIELAELVCEMHPVVDRVRFVSSGTEAAMSALRLARGVTDRDLVVKFSGCYHGHVDHMLVAAGSGLATFGQPDSAGVPAAMAETTRVLSLDDDEAVDELFAREGDRIAAVCLEPIPANNGLLLQRIEFLRHLREVTERHGALLIFDEVISGFRVAPGGATELYGIEPDLVALGKVIGGGLPVGAFGGRAELMEQLAPNGPVYQAGTLSGNPLAMTAGLTTLQVLEREDGWRRLEELGGRLQERMEQELETVEAGARLVRQGSLFWLALQPEPPRSSEAIDAAAPARYRRLFHDLLGEGIYLAPSAYEVGFLSLAHDENDVDRLAGAIARSLRQESGAGEGPT